MTSGLEDAEPCDYRQDPDPDLTDIVPLVAVPHRGDTIKPVEALAGPPLDQVFVGTCTNGRYSDLGRFARLVKGRRVAVRTIVIPASASVLERRSGPVCLPISSRRGAPSGLPGVAPVSGTIWECLGKGKSAFRPLTGTSKTAWVPVGRFTWGLVATAAASALEGEIASPEAA